jgi:hypothetical protein
MDQAILVGPDVSAGEKALATLQAAHIEPVVALLAVFPEYGDWRFVLSSPSLDQTHLLKAHVKVAEVLNGHFVYTLPTVMILPIKDPFIRDLRRLFGKAKDVTGMRLGGQRIGNRFIDAAYVYRIH